MLSKLLQKHHLLWKKHPKINTEKLKFHFSRKNCQKTKKERWTHLKLVLILSKIFNLLAKPKKKKTDSQFMKTKKKKLKNNLFTMSKKKAMTSIGSLMKTQKMNL